MSLVAIGAEHAKRLVRALHPNAFVDVDEHPGDDFAIVRAWRSFDDAADAALASGDGTIDGSKALAEYRVRYSKLRLA